MTTHDTCCTIAPYFHIADEHLAAFKKLCEEFVAHSKREPDCLYYGFSFAANQAHCREGYRNAEGLLAHLNPQFFVLKYGFRN